MNDLDDMVQDVIPTPQMAARTFSEWLSFADTGLSYEELPRPTLWHVLILPKQPKRMSAGGIALPDQAMDAEKYLNYIGQVVAMGPMAGKNERFQNPDYESYPGRKACGMSHGRWDADQPQRFLWDVKVGDWVLFGKYAGMGKTYKDVMFVTTNDDHITDVIDDPGKFTVYV